MVTNEKILNQLDNRGNCCTVTHYLIQQNVVWNTAEVFLTLWKQLSASFFIPMFNNRKQKKHEDNNLTVCINLIS